MLRAAAFAALLMTAPVAASEPADRLLACVVGQSVIEINAGAELNAALDAAWALCDPLSDIADEEWEGVEDHAFNTVYDYAEMRKSGFTLDGELGAEY